MQRKTARSRWVQCPSELVALKERIQDQPPSVREELEPLIDEVMEHAVFRSRVMLIARDASPAVPRRDGGDAIRSRHDEARTAFGDRPDWQLRVVAGVVVAFWSRPWAVAAR